MNCTTVDLIVVGAGVTGLTAALHCAKSHSSVLLLEASGRAGGQVYSAHFKDYVCSPVELGASFFNPIVHTQIDCELQRYNLRIRSYIHNKEYWMLRNKNALKLDVFEKSVLDHSVYQCAVRTMNKDAKYIVFHKGYNQLDLAYLDIPFSTYVEQTLLIHDDSSKDVTEMTKVKEYLLTQVYLLMGANPEVQSALSVLYLIAGFGSVERAFSLSKGVRTVHGGVSQWTNSMAEELVALGGEIRLNQPVIKVKSVPVNSKTASDGDSGLIATAIITSTTTGTLTRRPHPPNYDYPDGVVPVTRVEVLTASGEVICSRGIIVCTPLACLPSIEFDPPLPVALQQASQRCNAGGQLVKVFGRAANVSTRIDRVLGYSHKAKDVRTSDYSSSNSRSQYAAEEDGNDGGLATVEMWGNRSDLLLQQQQSIVTGTSGKALQSPFRAALLEAHPAAEFSPTVVTSVQNSGTSSSECDTSSTPSHVHYHDFVTDPWSRRSWFALRAGTAALHSQACEIAKSPWSRNHSSHSATVTDSGNSSSQSRYSSGIISGSEESKCEDGRGVSRATVVCDNGSLIVACSELHPVWTGWMEGATRAGRDAGERMTTYLIPPKIPRNFFKRQPLTPIQSPSRK